MSRSPGRCTFKYAITKANIEELERRVEQAHQLMLEAAKYLDSPHHGQFKNDLGHRMYCWRQGDKEI